MERSNPRRRPRKRLGILIGAEPTAPAPPPIVPPAITTNGGNDLTLQVNVGAIDALALSYVGSGSLAFDLIGPAAADFEVTRNGVVRFKAEATYTGELHSNDGRIYYAQAAGTTGATAPTHTSGSVSDGTVTWVYHGPVAALVAAPSV